MEGIGCSMEMEPRTLNEGELSSAREAAEDIIRNKDPNEASNIFTKGMQTVISIREMEQEVERRNQLHKINETTETLNRSWDFPCTSTTIEDQSPDISKIRDPLSSPF